MRRIKYNSILTILLMIIFLILSLIIIYYKFYLVENYENQNPKVILINYANKGYINSRKKQKETALSIAKIDEVIEYNFNDIDDEFKKECSQHFNQSRGAGYWVWKPYVISKQLNKMNDGDILVYCDSAADFKSSINHCIEKMKDYSIMLFPINEPEKKWTKKDIFSYLGVLNMNDVINTNQIEASFLILRKDNNSVNFIKDWLEVSKNYHLISDEESVEPNFPEFSENRHDQSLLSILGKKHKYNYNILFYESNVKEFLNHHRIRN